MPMLEKLDPEAVANLTRRAVPKIDLGEYIAFLGQVQPGDWGRLTLEEGENRRAVKRRLTTAAKELDLTIKYRQAEGRVLLFQVRTPVIKTEVTPVVESEGELTEAAPTLLYPPPAEAPAASEETQERPKSRRRSMIPAEETEAG